MPPFPGRRPGDRAVHTKLRPLHGLPFWSTDHMRRPDRHRLWRLGRVCRTHRDHGGRFQPRPPAGRDGLRARCRHGLPRHHGVARPDRSGTARTRRMSGGARRRRCRAFGDDDRGRARRASACRRCQRWRAGQGHRTGCQCRPERRECRRCRRRGARSDRRRCPCVDRCARQRRHLCQFAQVIAQAGSARPGGHAGRQPRDGAAAFARNGLCAATDAARHAGARRAPVRAADGHDRRWPPRSVKAGHPHDPLVCGRLTCWDNSARRRPAAPATRCSASGP
jgi:hypothetical protein